MSRKFFFRLGGTAFGVLMICAACTRSEKDSQALNAKDRFQQYVSTSFSISSVEDRKKLEGFLTDEAKSRLQAWSDEQFADAFIDKKRKFLKLVLRDVKPISPEKTQITYELTSIDQTTQGETKVTNKKLCYMIKKDGVWYIQNVKNIKLLVEYQNEMSLP